MFTATTVRTKSDLWWLFLHRLIAIVTVGTRCNNARPWRPPMRHLQDNDMQILLYGHSRGIQLLDFFFLIQLLDL